MQLEFWIERWQRGETGFHQTVTNPYLSYYYGEKGPGLDKRRGLKVFLPLCGKSHDMAWLVQNGYSVLGNECSEIAVRDFFENSNLSYTSTQSGKHTKYVAKRDNFDQVALEIFQGDFFDLSTEDLSGVSDVFDRAALIALPEDLRVLYVEKMAEILVPGIRTLLVTLNYPQHEMNGPPFSVSEDEVTTLYSQYFNVEKLLSKNILSDEERFQQRGLTALTETVYKLTRKK